MRRQFLSLLLLSTLTFFVGLGRPAVTDSDEAFYAEAAREMVDSGDWLTPHYNYEDRWQKPVLYYWLTAAAYLVSGPTEWAARVWSALSGAGLVLLTWAAARTISTQPNVGWLAGTVVATCFGCFAMARMALPDLPLAFCITLTVWAATRAVDHSVGWWALAGLGAGLGFLLKGPVALVVPAVILGPIAWRERSRILIKPSGVALAVAVFAIVGLPWYGAMLAEHGTAYAQSFFIGDNFERFATDRFNQPRPFWFYLPVVIGGMLPWSAYLVTLSVQPLKEVLLRKRRLTDAEWRLLFWALMPLLFYTLSVGKQPRYVLPVLPPLAILLSWAMVERVGNRTAPSGGRQSALLAGTWATFAFLCIVALLRARMRPLLIAIPDVTAWAGIAAVGLAAAAVAGVAIRRSWAALPAVLVTSSVALMLTIQVTVLQPSRPEPVELMANLVRQHHSPGQRVGAYRAFVRNLIFYSRIKQDDLMGQAAAVEFLKSPERVLLMLPADELSAIEAASGLVLSRLGEVTYVNTANFRLRTLLRSNPNAEVVRVLLVANR